MKIKLLERLNDKNYDFEFLKNNGIKAIRGPRKINNIFNRK